MNHNTNKPIFKMEGNKMAERADRDDLLAMTHVGEDPHKYMKAVTPPVFMTSLHVFDTV